MGSRLVSTYSPKSKAFDFGAWKTLSPIGVGPGDVEEDTDAFEWLKVEWNAYENSVDSGRLVVSGKVASANRTPQKEIAVTNKIFTDRVAVVLNEEFGTTRVRRDRVTGVAVVKTEYEDVLHKETTEALFHFPNSSNLRTDAWNFTGTWNSCAYEIKEYIMKDVSVSPTFIIARLKFDFVLTEEMQLDLLFTEALMQQAELADEYRNRTQNGEVRFKHKIGIMDTLRNIFFWKVLFQDQDSQIRLRIQCFRCEGDEEILFQTEIDSESGGDETFWEVAQRHKIDLEDVLWRVESAS